MATSRKKTTQKQIAGVEFTFYTYLNMFYRQNKSRITPKYNQLTKKFLSFNNPDNATAFLRRPQYEALEMYVFLKEYLNNAQMQDIFRQWVDKKSPFEGRKELLISQGDLFQNTSKQVYEQVFARLKENQSMYSNYIFALTMGLGKTILMGTCIFYEFILANKYPKDTRYCHNALVFAPDKTVLQSLKEIQTFDKSKVVPPEYVNWLETHLQFHFLDDSGISLNTIDNSQFNIIISNTQKIILKKQRKEKTSAQLFIEGTESVYKAKTLNEDYSDLYDFDSEIDLRDNQRFSKITRLGQLGIYIDEAHHAFGNKLDKELKSLRLTIDEVAAHLKEAGTRIVACYNYTGTPYVKNQVLPEVVYAYGLKEAIQNKYLKSVEVNGYTNARTKEFVRIIVEDFYKKFKGKRYEGMLPKLALFATTIEELEKHVKPAVEDTLAKLGVSTNRILVNVGDSKLTSNDDIREFINLDTPTSKKQFILLVNKGKEGWNCRSLFGVGLHRQPDSKIFVLQATMRCLRAITNVQVQGYVYLSKENKEILENELKENFNMTVEELNAAGKDESKYYEVKVVPPPRTIVLRRPEKRYEMIPKVPGAGIDFELEKIDFDRYKLTVETSNLENIHRLRSTEDLTVMRERRTFSPLTLVAEISRYLGFHDSKKSGSVSPLRVEELLATSKQGIQEIVQKTNQFNEILYDWIIPRLFKELWSIKEFEHSEDVTVSLVEEPSEGYFRVKAKPDLVVSIKDKMVIDKKGSSFHLDTYCFDSRPEMRFFLSYLLNNKEVDEIYFTGMLTHGQSKFMFHYIDPETNIVRNYYPDFLVKFKQGYYKVYEVKADGMIEDAVVKAKKEFAERELRSSNIQYEMVAASKYQ